MDNFQILVTSEGLENFNLAMRLAFPEHAVATHYQITEEKGMILFRTQPSQKLSDVVPLPYPMEVEDVLSFIWGWLQKAPLGPEPDHDGENHRGWTVFNEEWGRVNGMWQAFVAIKPIWAMYGK